MTVDPEAVERVTHERGVPLPVFRLDAVAERVVVVDAGPLRVTATVILQFMCDRIAAACIEGVEQNRSAQHDADLSSDATGARCHRGRGGQTEVETLCCD